MEKRIIAVTDGVETHTVTLSFEEVLIHVLYQTQQHIVARLLLNVARPICGIPYIINIICTCILAAHRMHVIS